MSKEIRMKKSNNSMNRWVAPIFSPPRKKLKSNENNSVSNNNRTAIEDDDCAITNVSKCRPINWMEKIAPVSVSELAVNSKKIREVEEWLKYAHSKKQRAPILLLTGPTGSGKTITVKVLCKQFKITLREWITPVDTEYVVENEISKQNYAITPQQGDVFLEFLNQARYPSLLEPNDNRETIVLVEDYPHAFVRDKTTFVDILKNYHMKNCIPIIFICTDTKDKNLNLASSLFPQALRDELQIVNISFIGVNATAMRTALQRATTIMTQKYNFYKPVPEEIIESIINSSCGDIRNAVINLHFASLKDSSSIPIMRNLQQQKPAKKSTRKAKDKNSKLKNMGRDDNLTIMHAVGRIMNPKRIDQKPHWKLSHSPESISDQFLSQPTNFVGFLYENYLKHFGNIHDVSLAVEGLSFGDQLIKDWKEMETSRSYALTIASRSLMVTNEEPVSAWNPVRGPARCQIEYPSKSEFPLLTDNPNGAALAIDYKSYYKIICCQ